MKNTDKNIKNAVNQSSLDNPCARCSQNFTTCCVTDLDMLSLCFPLSKLEQMKLKAFTVENNLESGITEEQNTEQFIDSMSNILDAKDVPELCDLSKTHMRLTVKENGACLFLTETGCILPRDIRPFYCRIFPFWITPYGLNYFVMDDCQAQVELRSKIRFFGEKSLLKTFNTTLDEVKALHLELHKAWGLK